MHRDPENNQGVKSNIIAPNRFASIRSEACALQRRALIRELLHAKTRESLKLIGIEEARTSGHARD